MQIFFQIFFGQKSSKEPQWLRYYVEEKHIFSLATVATTTYLDTMYIRNSLLLSLTLCYTSSIYLTPQLPLHTSFLSCYCISSTTTLRLFSPMSPLLQRVIWMAKQSCGIFSGKTRPFSYKLLEPVCCTKQQKKLLTNYWFVEQGTSEDSEWYKIDPG